MKTIPNEGILAPAGFHAGSVACGIKSAAGALDVTVIVSETCASAAATFTTNRFAAASVHWNRTLLPTDDLRAVAVNAGNANAFTGQQGHDDVRATTELVARLLRCRPSQVCVASTGIIGHPLPMDKLTRGITDACDGLSLGASAADCAARAIMTTDTHAKLAAVESEAAGRKFRIGGIAKGSGMIAPNMATMLAFITTDAAVAPDVLHRCLRGIVDVTFNCITVDGDSSTNDTVLVMAGGASGTVIESEGASLDAFRQALHAVLADLCHQIVADGEGATHVVRVRVLDAADVADAERAARAVAESQLFKCAIAGGDPNWGRIVCALGYSGADVRAETTTVSIGDVCVVRDGVPTGQDASAPMQLPEFDVTISLGRGEGDASVLTCDLTHEYVSINADYHT
jgi:glutamate N-acetyltransferase / amino-acid N-acetyltransferase